MAKKTKEGKRIVKEKKHEETQNNKNVEEKINKDDKSNSDVEIEKLKSDVDHWKNEYYRAYADMQNLRKRIEADHREAIKYRAEGFVSDLLPILDGFHMALNAETKSPEMKNFLVGFEFIYRNLVNVLENEGVKEFSPKIGEEFDPSYMQAIETEVNEKDPNKIVKVVTKGYKLHDHLIRPAMVVVTIKEKNDKEQKNNDENVQNMDA
ncbi:MAG TPA: nucleotide exchange factor GrpE [Firmicutes bacterium]|nr:nucleotide exchange factor GrpE [Bacillota bacterium]